MISNFNIFLDAIPSSGVYETTTLNSFQDYLIKVIIPIVLMLIFTFFVGYERQNMGKAAGLSAHTLVGLGSVGLSIVQRLLFEHALIHNISTVQGQRIVAQIVTGIGFLGAGVIMKDRLSVKGLTTAATIWATALLGIIMGLGFLVVGSIVAIVIIVFILIRDIKRGVNPLRPYKQRKRHVIKYSYYHDIETKKIDDENKDIVETIERIDNKKNAKR